MIILPLKWLNVAVKENKCKVDCLWFALEKHHLKRLSLPSLRSATDEWKEAECYERLQRGRGIKWDVRYMKQHDKTFPTRWTRPMWGSVVCDICVRERGTQTARRGVWPMSNSVCFCLSQGFLVLPSLIPRCSAGGVKKEHPPQDWCALVQTAGSALKGSCGGAAPIRFQSRADN